MMGEQKRKIWFKSNLSFNIRQRFSVVEVKKETKSQTLRIFAALSGG